MTTFPINNETVYPFPPGTPSSNPGAAQIGQFLTPNTPPNGGPDLNTTWNLESIWIPVSTEVLSDPAQPMPSEAYLTLQMLVSGALVWQQRQTIPLLPTAVTNARNGMGTFADSMPNPVPFRNGQRFTLAYAVQTDTAIFANAGNPLMFVTIGGVWTQAGGQITPGSVAYSEVFSPIMMPAISAQM